LTLFHEDMANFDASQNRDDLDTSVRKGAVPLESVLCTEELHRRPWRPPDYEKENSALSALARALAESPHTILQVLADTILGVFEADSAGLSLLTTHDGGKRFYWPAIAGVWKPHIGGGTPRDFGPCGDVLDRNAPLLFRHFELRYTYFLPVTPPVEECLLVPFYVHGKAVGTIWAIAHDQRRKFDAEDKRILESLGTFASSAYQIHTSLDSLKFEMAERQDVEATLRQNDERLRTLTDTLEEQVRVRTEQLEQRNTDMLKQSEQLREISHSLMQIQDHERRRIARELHDSLGQVLAALGMNLGAVAQRAKQNAPDLVTIADEGRQLVKQLDQEMRTMSYLLYPPLLDESGLPFALSCYIRGLKDRSGLDATLIIPEDFGRLSGEMELAIFRIVQECLTNVHRHSESTKAMIRIGREGDRVLLEVEDNGKGMSPEKLQQIQSQGSGVGIKGMRERIRQLNGHFDIMSDSHGTKVSVTFPAAEIDSAGIR
jgi:signal transduction histidine kinase